MATLTLTRAPRRPVIICITLARLMWSLLLTVLAPSGPASAQTATIDTTQSALLKKSPLEQSTILGEAVRGALKDRKCKPVARDRTRCNQPFTTEPPTC